MASDHNNLYEPNANGWLVVSTTAAANADEPFPKMNVKTEWMVFDGNTMKVPKRTYSSKKIHRARLSVHSETTIYNKPHRYDIPLHTNMHSKKIKDKCVFLKNGKGSQT